MHHVKKKKLKNPEQIDHFKGHQCILKKYFSTYIPTSVTGHLITILKSGIPTVETSLEPIEKVSLNAKLSVCCF